jgi:hypothetical protein
MSLTPDLAIQTESNHPSSLDKWLTENLATIVKIEKQFGFKPNTLASELRNVMVFNAQIKKVVIDISTPSIRKNKASGLRDAATELRNSLKRISKKQKNELDKSLSFLKLGRTSVAALDNRVKFLHDLFVSEKFRQPLGVYTGNLVFSALVTLKCHLTDTPFQLKLAIDHIIKVTHENRPVTIQSINKELTPLINACKTIIDKPVKEGRPYAANIKNFLLRIMAVYEHGTGKTPRINHTGVPTAPYVSDFYDFITEILPLVSNSLPEKTTPSQIASQARQIMPHYNSLKK